MRSMKLNRVDCFCRWSTDIATNIALKLRDQAWNSQGYFHRLSGIAVKLFILASVGLNPRPTLATLYNWNSQS